MKNLTYYFSSPSREGESSVCVNSVQTQNATTEKGEKLKTKRTESTENIDVNLNKGKTHKKSSKSVSASQFCVGTTSGSCDTVESTTKKHKNRLSLNTTESASDVIEIGDKSKKKDWKKNKSEEILKINDVQVKEKRKIHTEGNISLKPVKSEGKSKSRKNVTVKDVLTLENHGSEDESKEINSLENSAKEQNGIVIYSDMEQTSDEKHPVIVRKNVFKFMMDNRHKSIGNNSPGKELDKPTEADEEKVKMKEELSARKAIFQDWANKKGGLKRKLEDEEKQAYITKKLETRAKRMKKMLMGQNPTETEAAERIPTKKKRPQKIESDSENDFESQIRTMKKRPQKIESDSENSSEVQISQGTTTSKSISSQQQRGLEKGKSDKTSKLNRKSKLSLNKKAEVFSGNENVETPGAGKRWQMRVRLLNHHDGTNLSDSCSEMSFESDKEANIGDDEKKVEEVEETDEKNKVPMKLAPLFVKMAPKAKPDPAVLEARRNFLLSGVPSSLRRKVRKEKSIEEADFDVFPAVSHVQQKPLNVNSTNLNFWNLPETHIKLKVSDSDPVYSIQPLKLGLITGCNSESNTKSQLLHPHARANIKQIVQEIKRENPDYPVYRYFKLLRQTTDVRLKPKPETVESTSCNKRRRGRPKKNRSSVDRSLEIIEPEILRAEEAPVAAAEYLPWSEKYKPRSSEEVIGNRSSVSGLKKWLESWLHFSESIYSQRAKRIRDSSSSSSEFDMADGDSKDGASFPGNAVILCGPHGVGKTASVYAVCNELGINVLELNASSKRTGKRLLQELQEATQSHQVRENKNHVACFLGKNENTFNNPDHQTKKKFCLLLIDDIDVIFDQDEGFVNALNQLLATSKRPVALITKDPNCSHIQRFIAQYPIIKFSPPSAGVLATWLQIICALQGLHVDRQTASELLEWNNGDVRRTLHCLEFWAQSGGQIFPKSRDKRKIGGDFEKSALPYSEDLGKIWWSLPNICGDLSEAIVNREEKEKLHEISSVFDSFAVADVAFNQLCVKHSIEPAPSFWTRGVADSLEINERSEGYCEGPCLVQEWTRFLLEKSTENLQDTSFYYTAPEGEDTAGHAPSRSAAPPHYYYSAPNLQEKKWRAKQHSCENKLLEVVPHCCVTDRKSLTTDYFAALRDICRSEASRAKSNNKRGNRFYHYLRGVGVDCSDSTLNTACTVFNLES